MLRGNDGLALRFYQPQVLRQLRYRRHVQIGGRLVQQVHLRLHRVDGGKGDLLLLPAGQGKDAAAEKRLYMQRSGRLINAGPQLFLCHGLVLHAEGDLAVGVHVEKLRARILEHAARLLRDAVHGQGGNILPVHQHPACQLPCEKLRYEPVYKPRQRGFPAAASAAQQHELPVRNGEADVFQSAAGVAGIGK